MSVRLRSVTETEGSIHLLNRDCLSLVLELLYDAFVRPKTHNIKGMRRVWRLAITCKPLYRMVSLFYGEMTLTMRSRLCPIKTCKGKLSATVCHRCKTDVCCKRCGHVCDDNAICNSCLADSNECFKCGYRCCPCCQHESEAVCDACDDEFCDDCLCICEDCEYRACPACRHTADVNFRTCHTCGNALCDDCRDKQEAAFACESCDEYYCETCVVDGLAVKHDTCDEGDWGSDICHICYKANVDNGLLSVT
jgi:hypothetical protein